MEHTKAVAYLRVSSAEQAGEDRDGFPRQKAAIQRWADANGIKVVKWYEEDISGTTNPLDRPKFADMLTRLLANGVKCVLVEKYDRLARTSMWIDWTILKFQERGLDLISVAEPELANADADPVRKAMRNMVATFAELERGALVKKLKDARMRARRKDPANYKEGRKPFGHFAGEPETLKRMQKLRTDGHSYQAIADKLNQADCKPRASDTWYPSSVQAILKANQ
jgi:site-specific DNA recombinase